MDNPAKKIALSVLSSVGDKPDAHSGYPDLDGGVDGKSMAAKEMMEAFQSKDAKKLVSSLQSFIEQCYADDDDMED